MKRLPLLLIPIFAVQSLQASQVALLKPCRMDLLREGRPVGFVMLPAGTRVDLVSKSGEGWLVRRSPGENPFTVPADALPADTAVQGAVSGGMAAGNGGASETAPSASPASTPTSAPTPSPSPLAASRAASPATVTAQPSKATSPSPGTSATAGKSLPDAAAVNKALGIPLFPSKGSLWEENDSMVAGRLKWPEESRTTLEAGYRRYPYTYNSDTKVLGVKSLSLFLQGVGGHPARVTILFANKGDILFYANPEELKKEAASEYLIVTDRMWKACRDTMTHDRSAVETALTALLGDPKPVRMGRFAAMAEAAQRWDWKGHSFLLTSPQNEYVALRILPTEALEDADADRKAFAAARADLPRRVEHRDNGDVILSDLPMVDQGRKGYCVPATFERTLRYYGLSEDMNILAMAGQTEPGGGTFIPKIQESTCAMLSDAGARITHVNFNGSYLEIKPYIDAGKPVLFPLHSTKEFNKRLRERMASRVAVSDWARWKDSFLPSLKKTEPLKPDPLYRHLCLIIGYNASTGEIAISDSWGAEATERWMTEEEARQVRQGQSVTVIE